MSVNVRNNACENDFTLVAMKEGWDVLMVYIAASWGLPKNWSVVKYSFEMPSKEIKSHLQGALKFDLTKEVEGTTPVALILEALGNIQKKVRAFVPISIASVYVDVDERFCENLERLIEALKDEQKLRDIISKGVEIEVVPNSLSNVKPTFSFPTSNTLSFLAATLYKDLRDTDEKYVIVDVSHGFNYITISFLRAIEDVLKAISLKGVPINEFVIISDPVFRGVTEAKVRFLYKDRIKMSLRHALSELTELISKDKDERKGMILLASDAINASAIPLLMVSLEMLSKENYMKEIDEQRKNARACKASNDEVRAEMEVSYEQMKELIYLSEMAEFYKKKIKGLLKLQVKNDLLVFEGGLEGLKSIATKYESELEVNVFWKNEIQRIDSLRKEVKEGKIPFDKILDALKTIKIKDILNDELNGKEEIVKELGKAIEDALEKSMLPLALLKHYGDEDLGKTLQETIKYWANAFKERNYRNLFAHAGLEMYAFWTNKSFSNVGYYLPYLRRLLERWGEERRLRRGIVKAFFEKLMPRDLE